MCYFNSKNGSKDIVIKKMKELLAFWDDTTNEWNIVRDTRIGKWVVNNNNGTLLCYAGR